MTNFVLMGIAAAAGIAGALQSATNGGLASRIGLAAALIVNTSVVLLGTFVFYFAIGAEGSFFPSGTPWALYVGGIYGFIVIAALAFVFPKIGAAVTIAVLVFGQGMAALAIDHFGLLGMPQAPITLARVVGLLLVGGGIAMLRA